ncbi:hypothetical protein ACZ90_16840 [Streptomyces albus subsp. albus]|nr:hypothetical protein ACZ90_16840 [Streptomyces albus subsp. albus]
MAYGTVTAVSSSAGHTFGKESRESVTLLAGLGVEGDAHAGVTVKVVEVTGLRNPCLQIEAFQEGLLKQVVGRDATGAIVRRAGVMSVVRRGGVVRPGDPVAVELPAGPHRPLERV